MISWFKRIAKENKIRPFLVVLAIVGLIQSMFTNIGFDESYYWRFAQDLDWAYFDHPPMVALMISIGDAFLPGTLGVRFMTVVFSIFTYYFLWLSIPEDGRSRPKSALIFFLLVLSNPLLNIYSFITTPDVPLLFFSALYLYLFQKFLKEATLKSSLILGLVMAGLIYSKYHGLLLILITVFVNPSLFRRGHIYLAGITGILLYLPHLWWQYEHDFISFNYHLSYRSVQFYAKNVYMYFINSILVLNPFILPLFLLAFFKRGFRHALHNRTLNAVIWVFLGFFAFTSFRGHVEPQWILIVVLPMTIYLHQYLTTSEKTSGYFFPLAYTSLVLIAIARIAIMLPLNIDSEFHKPDEKYYKSIQEIAEGRPVIFANSYTQSSRYSFYTGEPSFSYNFVSFRKNQYDLWPYHEAFDGKDVMFATFSKLGGYQDTVIDESKTLYYKYIDKIPVVNNIKVEVLDYERITPKKGDLKITFRASNPYREDVVFGKQKIKWMIYFFYLDKERAFPADMVDGYNTTLRAQSDTTITGIFKVDIPADQYTFGIHIYPQVLFPISVSKRTHPIQVGEKAEK